MEEKSKMIATSFTNLTKKKKSHASQLETHIANRDSARGGKDPTRLK